MNKIIHLSSFCLTALFIFSLNLNAQEQTEITVQVKKDGKVVKDTTYQFDDDKQAKHAVKMMEVMSGDDEHVMVMKSGDGETFDILVDKDFEGGDMVGKKQVKVIVSGDEHGTWHVDGKELEHIDEDVYVISGDDVKVELKEILEEHGDGEDVKVIVVKTKKK